jgi:helix-turn-helix protein/uncharacterized protein DUF4115
VATLGERLRQGRDAKGLTVQAVSNATKIREHILASLESDNYTALPAPVFVRGFLRTLARQLNLNSEELLALYAAVTSPAEAPQPEIEPSKLYPPKVQPIKARPVKLQPTQGHAPEGRIARLQARNGLSAASAAQSAPATNGHLADEQSREPVPSNGHLTGAHATEPARANGHLGDTSRSASGRTNGRLKAAASSEPTSANGHEAELSPLPKKSSHGRLSRLLSTGRLNGHAAGLDAGQQTPLNGHATAEAANATLSGEAVKRPATVPANPRPTLTLVRPNWMTANILMSGMIALLLVAGVAWGGGQMLKGLEQSRPVKALQQAQPTIAAMIQLDPTATPTLDPTQSPAAAVPTVTVDAPATATPLPLRNLELKLDATARTWVRIESDGAEAFQGTLEAGMSKGVTAHSRIVMRAGNAGGVNVTVNGKLLGLLGGSGDVVDKQWVIDDAGAVASVTPVWANPIVSK